ncbi:MAG: helix-turn-helix transcriptional regulator [Clostridia bacterium]|nr:helix-turn-helix transcriptional regulator [Clostridia bacterium]
MSFSDNLKYLRKNFNIDQGVLAEALNVSPKTISHWETNYTEPSISQLIMIADFFQVSLDDLVDRK